MRTVATFRSWRGWQSSLPSGPAHIQFYQSGGDLSTIGRYCTPTLNNPPTADRIRMKAAQQPNTVQ